MKQTESATYNEPMKLPSIKVLKVTAAVLRARLVPGLQFFFQNVKTEEEKKKTKNELASH